MVNPGSRGLGWASVTSLREWSTGGQSPALVADQLDVSLAEVYGALSYYYSNIDEIRAYECENEAAFDHVRDDP